jgi:hypothetical protein
LGSSQNQEARKYGSYFSSGNWNFDKFFLRIELRLRRLVVVVLQILYFLFEVGQCLAKMLDLYHAVYERIIEGRV